MKVILRLLVMSFLLSSSIVQADVQADNKQENVRTGDDITWSMQADQTIERFNNITLSIMNDVPVFNEWARMLSEIADQMAKQQEIYNQSIKQLQANLYAANQQIHSLQMQQAILTQEVQGFENLQAILIQKIQDLENQCVVSILQAKQEQFILDGQKAVELISTLKSLQKELSFIVDPEKEALFNQLQILSDSLSTFMQQNAEQSLQVIQALQDNAQVV